MKYHFALFIIPILFFACKYNVRGIKPQTALDTIQTKKDTVVVTPGQEDNSTEDDQDSINITFNDLRDTLTFSKRQFDQIGKYYPELTETEAEYPDEAYAQMLAERAAMTKEQKESMPSFASELGIDEYYMLYAYFLKERNGDKEYKNQRKTLIELFRNINTIHGKLEHGGTGVGHEVRRIEGYAEYAVYAYAHYNDTYKREYDIARQKVLFINSLKQMIADEVAIDNNGYSEFEKHEWDKEMFVFVDKVNDLITDYFYLKQAQQFEYSQFNR